MDIGSSARDRTYLSSRGRGIFIDCWRGLATGFWGLGGGLGWEGRQSLISVTVPSSTTMATYLRGGHGILTCFNPKCTHAGAAGCTRRRRTPSAFPGHACSALARASVEHIADGPPFPRQILRQRCLYVDLACERRERLSPLGVVGERMPAALLHLFRVVGGWRSWLSAPLRHSKHCILEGYGPNIPSGAIQSSATFCTPATHGKTILSID